MLGVRLILVQVFITSMSNPLHANSIGPYLHCYDNNLRLLPLSHHIWIISFSLNKKNRARRGQPRCIPPTFYHYSSMPGYFTSLRQNVTSTMQEYPRSTPSALCLSTVNLHSTSIEEFPGCTSSASWPYHLQHGNTHIYRYICKDWSWPNNMLHQCFYILGQPQVLVTS